MGLVIDASATLPWCFEDEATPWTEALLDRLEGGELAIVPAHWALEVTNSLLVAIRRGRLSASHADDFTEDLAALPIRIESACHPARWTDIIKLAQEHRLTAYDAAYLELAPRLSLPLATLDGPLRKAAELTGLLLT